jgi:hypothetical protein
MSEQPEPGAPPRASKLAVVATAISMASTGLGGWLTVQNHDLERRSRAIEDANKELQQELARSKELRDTDEFALDYNLRVYEKVVAVFAQPNPSEQSQRAILAVIKALRETPFKAEIAKAVSISAQADETVRAEAEIVQTVADFAVEQRAGGGTRSAVNYDVFWCEANPGLEPRAEAVAAVLQRELRPNRVRVRKLPRPVNAQPGYNVARFEIRAERGESGLAEEVRDALAKGGTAGAFSIVTVSNSTPWYLSIFLCEGRGS